MTIKYGFSVPDNMPDEVLPSVKQKYFRDIGQEIGKSFVFDKERETYIVHLFVARTENVAQARDSISKLLSIAGNVSLKNSILELFDEMGVPDIS